MKQKGLDLLDLLIFYHYVENREQVKQGKPHQYSLLGIILLWLFLIAILILLIIL